MMVKLKTSRVGHNLSQKEGDVVEIKDAKEAQRMIDAGQCEEVKPEHKQVNK